MGAGAGRGDTEFTTLTGLANLHSCWLKAKKNKSGSLRVQRFDQDPLRHLLAIQQRLRGRTYVFGPYKTFVIREKKHRDVVDSPMKDRVVHWMLYQYLLPIWQPRFIADTFGNLPGRGTHAAVRRLAQFARADGATWVLQLDISKYFYSINHELLKTCALRYIGDQDIRSLLVDLIDSFQTGDAYDHLFAADSMYRTTAAKGMPIGSLMSQVLANILLNEFDHWVKEVLRVRWYLRYVDDITALGSCPEELRAIRDAIIAKLAAMGLTIHPRKTRLAPVAAGVPYLGYVVWRNHISAGTFVRCRFIRRLREHESGGYDRTDTLQAYAAMFSHTGPTNSRASANAAPTRSIT